MYDTILLPFDGSEGAAELLHHAGEIAHWADATVRVLYVADTARDSVTVVDGSTVDGLVQRGEEVVDEAAETLETLGVPHETDVVQGDPAPTVVEYAERYDHDLIAMPTRGREGVSRYVNGSVTEKVVRLSSVPVLTARMRPDETFAFPYEDVLVPTDGSAAAAYAAEHLVEFAAALDATVHVLSVVDDTALGLASRSASAGEENETAAADAVESVVSTADAHGVDTVRHVEHGSPIEVIADSIESNDVDAVGMGTTGRRGTDRILLGSVAEETVRSAPVPVVTVAEPE
ncbi:universal stress protein [Candidatus Halobonum tyrrellensis]|uniref:UspA domain-containing protein n=1 Tax=Candidatus Halobonum tyrrellensis G22 TaxID=1324957 RepID=V4IZI2_9EURY|nr:universal stress protein [Candidatus Halobonum tyrrellensis]ESP88542.1 UspA domain-containing protein [Candidatus Halobonum tyrrellensis G22]